ncbi:hypothetical protein TPHA_0M00180 [Tetrapisispora phaffii CBS 4417]|uniref:Condensation domain-containing protein n=1 Tax=Tetrapisispora phaffii (strain ATCC 24235 / CBS 4417 / NBRC 1672 / NRRL Y-8282 / UCD 70-5) TaxID=1071381 RepID=G8C0T5_TETPH|nr:hypothetical protein TPHA_0M00180 [Tetrapisispora phaffii CBS 4417]CCE65596.1 hypothetical protein TPHA_0M00180 [Tetrapisispora phaffii CBS 4417]
MPFRALGGYEKKVLAQTIEGRRNGVVFSSQITFNKKSDEFADDNATLYTGRSVNEVSLKSVLCAALQNIICNHVELYTTINDRLYFTPVLQIETNDVIKTISYDKSKDKALMKDQISDKLLRHIFNKCDFKPNNGKPLWQFSIANDSTMIFHGHDVLFDIFSTANFEKYLLKEMNDVLNSNQKLKTVKTLFKFDAERSLTNYPRSIYENPKLHLPALTSDLLNLQTQSFFKTIYQNTLKKPIDLITSANSNNNNQLSEYRTRNTDILSGANSLCGRTVLGEISLERYQHLKMLVEQENISLRSFISAITMVCLKPIVKNFDGSIIFSIPVNLRSLIADSSDFGLFYKNIKVECPLELINDEKYYTNPEVLHSMQNNSLLEIQFERISRHVSDVISQRMKAWEKFGFNDDDIKRMKFSNDEKTGIAPIIQINDVTEISFDFGNDNISYSFSVNNLNFTKSLSCNEFMSLFYSHNAQGGLNICIHYPDGYNMEAFVECFQSFIEN